MKTKKFLIRTIGLLIAFCIVAAGLTGDNIKESIANNNKSKNFRYVQNEAYGFGEKLEYKVGHKLMTVGTGYFYIQPNPIYKYGRPCYDIRFEVKSLPSLEWLYKVQDQYRTALDVGGIFPWEFEQIIREGKYRRHSTAVFNPFNNTATVKNKTYYTPEYVHDIVSAFFYVRTMNLSAMKNGTTFYVKHFFDDTTMTLGVKVHRRETVEVDAGKFKCIVIEPLVVKGGLFKSEGNIFIWLTDDERKIPVKVATKILIGYVGAELVRYSGVRGPVDARIK